MFIEYLDLSRHQVIDATNDWSLANAKAHDLLIDVKQKSVSIISKQSCQILPVLMLAMIG